MVKGMTMMITIMTSETDDNTPNNSCKRNINDGKTSHDHDLNGRSNQTARSNYNQ